MWKCTCGNNLTDNVNYCTNCGAPKPVKKEENDNGNWFYVNQKKRIGPFPSEIIVKKIENGEIQPDTLVWQSGFFDWKKAKDTTLNQHFSLILPPLPKETISDKWAWCLATIPLFVDMILNCLLSGEGIFYVSLFTIWILNCTFLYLDKNELEKAGINMNHYIWLWFVLIPLYMFIRANKTNRNFGPPILWCVLFLLSTVLSLVFG